MDINIAMTTTEVIVTSVVPPIAFAVYYTLKAYIAKDSVEVLSEKHE